MTWCTVIMWLWLNCRYTVSAGWSDLSQSSWGRHISGVRLSSSPIPRSASSSWPAARQLASPLRLGNDRRRGPDGQGGVSRRTIRRCPCRLRRSSSRSRWRGRPSLPWIRRTLYRHCTSNVVCRRNNSQTIYMNFCFVVMFTALYASVVSYQSLVFTFSPT